MLAARTCTAVAGEVRPAYASYVSIDSYLHHFPSFVQLTPNVDDEEYSITFGGTNDTRTV